MVTDEKTIKKISVGDSDISINAKYWDDYEISDIGTELLPGLNTNLLSELRGINPDDESHTSFQFTPTENNVDVSLHVYSDAINPITGEGTTSNVEWKSQIDAATSTSAGVMSAADKTNLDNLVSVSDATAKVYLTDFTMFDLNNLSSTFGQDQETNCNCSALSEAILAGKIIYIPDDNTATGNGHICTSSISDDFIYLTVTADDITYSIEAPKTGNYLSYENVSYKRVITVSVNEASGRQEISFDGAVIVDTDSGWTYALPDATDAEKQNADSVIASINDVYWEEYSTDLADGAVIKANAIVTDNFMFGLPYSPQDVLDSCDAELTCRGDFKTINGEEIVGEGDIAVLPLSGGTLTGDLTVGGMTISEDEGYTLLSINEGVFIDNDVHIGYKGYGSLYVEQGLHVSGDYMLHGIKHGISRHKGPTNIPVDCDTAICVIDSSHATYDADNDVYILNNDITLAKETFGISGSKIDVYINNQTGGELIVKMPRVTEYVNSSAGTMWYPVDVPSELSVVNGRMIKLELTYFIDEWFTPNKHHVIYKMYSDGGSQYRTLTSHTGTHLLKPGIYYDLGVISNEDGINVSYDVSLPNSTRYFTYQFAISSDLDNTPPIILPSSDDSGNYTWVNGEPTFEQGKIYQISVLNNICICVSV